MDSGIVKVVDKFQVISEIEVFPSDFEIYVPLSLPDCHDTHVLIIAQS